MLESFWLDGRPVIDEQDSDRIDWRFDSSVWRIMIVENRPPTLSVLHYPPRRVLEGVLSLPKNWVVV